ncbi:uncharacterized protein LOC111057874 [Nilaparvata lugens]|uniref:uncharacterized protein LOC111057874 n=1 Tax=Nilaparvata lugens TaxID=108931 RepID=UPI00193E3B46|nr:uncharacterized protein LOC111057874 [Nilaparvata lugens]
MVMKAARVFYPYEALNETHACVRLHARHAAITSAIYTLNISILVMLIYSWRVNSNFRKQVDLQDVYYGVQIAYFAIIGTQLFMIILSALLLVGVLKERSGLVVTWIVGVITFIPLEAVAMVYSNVLRDHVNREFDYECKAEVAFFLCRGAMSVSLHIFFQI